MPTYLVDALATWGLTPDAPDDALRAAIEAHGLVAECFPDRGDGASRYAVFCARIHDPARPDLDPTLGWGADGYRDALVWALARFLVAAER